MSPLATIRIWLQCLVTAAALVFLPTSARADDGARLELSSSADFTAQQRLFQADDVVHLRVHAPQLDAAAATKSTFEIDPQGDGTSFSGVLDNHLDGTFTASVAVADLAGSSRLWEVEVEIETENGASFEEHATIVILGKADRPVTFSLTGEVEAATSSELTIAGETIVLTSETAIIAEGGTSLTADALVGAVVTVHAFREADGSARALQLFVHTDARGELAISGPLGSIVSSPLGTTIRVHGLAVTVDASTRIETEAGASVALDDELQGRRVDVQARWDGSAWVASLIVLHILLDRTGDEEDVEDEGAEEEEVAGPVEEVGADYLVVAGLRLEVNGETELQGVSRLEEIGVMAQVEAAFVVAEGANVAVRVEVEEEQEEEASGEEVEAEGTITALTETTLEVGGVTFALDADTRVEGRGSAAWTLADLYTGLEVEVRGATEGGTLVATRIEVEGELATEREVKGRVTARTEETLTIDGTTFFVTSETQIEGDGAASFGEVEVGMRAEATLVVSADGRLTATELEVEDERGGRRVVATGRIEAVSASEITVSGLTFALTAETVIENRHEQPIEASELSAGQLVRVKGRQTTSGALQTTHVRVRERLHAEGTIEGEVTAVTAGALEVAGVSFRLDALTHLEGIVDIGSVAVGERVEVYFRLLGDGSRLVLKVEREEETEAEVKVKGAVSSVTTDVLVVAGIEMALGAGTEIVGADGTVMAAADLAVGMAVEVRAAATGTGLEAVRVRVEEAVVVSSTVESSGEGTIHVSGRQIRITDETLIVGANNRVLTAAEIEAGAHVEVIAAYEASAGKTQSGELVASRVLVDEAATETSVERGEVAGVPSSFVLEGNYPNPFNPTTTIAFEITRADAGSVSLVVFNVLGQQMQTLVRGALPAGRHAFAWDGRDAHGRPAASGVYLYRLQVGSQVETRTMTLLK